jgi:hypothetical protein
MLRGALIWLGLILSLVVVWRLAEAASGEERTLREAYASEAGLMTGVEEGLALGAAARPAPRLHDCELEPMDCDEFSCERRDASFYSRFQ